VVWPEGSNVVIEEDEPTIIAAASDAARRHGIELVISYIMPISYEPLLYENRARWFAPDGTERLAYLKHHPVPGEPAVYGEAPAPMVDTTFGPATAAICYDYDFPALGRAHARSGAALVAVSSSSSTIRMVPFTARSYLSAA
jgi:apolipoprotein N-acyltransferase